MGSFLFVFLSSKEKFFFETSSSTSLCHITLYYLVVCICTHLAAQSKKVQQSMLQWGTREASAMLMLSYEEREDCAHLMLPVKILLSAIAELCVLEEGV